MRQPYYLMVIALLSVGDALRGQEKETSLPAGALKVTSSNGPWMRVSGKAKVVNAYTLHLEDGTEVDLRFAIDAPELEQKGLMGGRLYPCGKEAAEFLVRLIGDRPVTVFDDREDAPARKKLRGPCFVGETHLQLEMVRNGWAISHHSGMDAWEIIARDNKRGLWRGPFVAPKKWRQGERLPGEEPVNSD